jgi:hypothetical protein
MRRTPSPLEQLNIALVGAASRGGSFASAFAAHPRTRIHAVCDVRGDLVEEAKALARCSPTTAKCWRNPTSTRS